MLQAEKVFMQELQSQCDVIYYLQVKVLDAPVAYR